MKNELLNLPSVVEIINSNSTFDDFLKWKENIIKNINEVDVQNKNIESFIILFQKISNEIKNYPEEKYNEILILMNAIDDCILTLKG